METNGCMARPSHMCLAVKQHPQDKHCCLLLHLMNAKQQTFSNIERIWRMPTYVLYGSGILVTCRLFGLCTFCVQSSEKRKEAGTEANLTHWPKLQQWLHMPCLLQ